MKKIVTFGEVLLRLSARGQQLLASARTLDMHVGGAEANVAVQLAHLGHPASMISALPLGSLGDAALMYLRGHGVDIDGVLRTEGRMGLYFVSPGVGVRASSIQYDRADSTFCLTAPDAWDWDLALSGARYLHVSGITPSLGRSNLAAVMTAIAAADRLGVGISFDGNYRSQLWAKCGYEPRAALVPMIDRTELLFGNHRDISLLLGRDFPGTTVEERKTASQAAFDRFPRLQWIASTIRRVDDRGCRLAARVDTRTEAFETPAVELTTIVDRIGSGDAYAAGVISGIIQSLDIAAIAGRGLALAALKHTVRGDGSAFSNAEVATFAAGQFDVVR